MHCDIRPSGLDMTRECPSKVILTLHNRRSIALSEDVNLGKPRKPRGDDLPKAARTVYSNVLPLIISHCDEIKSPIPARKQRFAIKTDWFVTPRKPMADRDKAINVVANPPNPNAL